MRRPLFFILACSLNGVVLGADQSVLATLMRMQTALQDLNYHGTLVYQQDGQVQSMKVIHKAGKNGEYERLINLNGIAREVIRKDDVVTCYMPESKAVTVSKRQFNRHALSKLAENDFSTLQNYYHFKLENEDRVAGLRAQRVLIEPKDRFRYGYRLWLDTEHALLLKSDLLNESGQVLEQAMFANITIVDQIPMAMVEPSFSGEGFNWFEHKNSDSDNGDMNSTSGWNLQSLPNGFTVSAHFRQPMHDSTEKAEQWIVTDGLASVSIYVEKITQGHDVFEGLSQAGAVNIFGALVDDHQVTVVGEVPAITVGMIARSLKLNAMESVK